MNDPDRPKYRYRDDAMAGDWADEPSATDKSWHYSVPIKLFAYGTLKERSIVEVVLGRRWSGNYWGAELDNYCLLPTQPAFIVPAYSHAVRGVVLDDLDVGDFEALDHFEGTKTGLYVRKSTTLPVFGKVYFYTAGREVMPQLRAALKDYAEYAEVLEGIDGDTDIA